MIRDQKLGKVPPGGFRGKTNENMILKNIKLSFRNILKNKGISFINITWTCHRDDGCIIDLAVYKL